jgi:biotin carboxyl carrier protein
MSIRPSDISSNGSDGDVPLAPAPAVTPAATGPASRRRSPLPLAIVAALFIIMPFLAWYFTWFGRNLSDDTIDKYLADQASPRHVQHALTQIEARIEMGDQSVKRWYPQILQLAGSNTMEVRQTVAWVMGQDNQSEEFHAALQRLLHDSEPIVRRNAALGITRFNDKSGRAELLAALQPFVVPAPAEGILISYLPIGSKLSVGTMLARIEVGKDQVNEVRAPLPGLMEKVFSTEGARLKAGDSLVSTAPDEASVMDALLALRFAGEAGDIPAIQTFTQNMSGRVKEQAALTAKAIQSRSAVHQ